jgi:hypothetical protein
MDTREITQVRPSRTKRPRRMPLAAIVAGLALVILVAVVGALAVGSGVPDGGRQTTPAQVVHVAQGHTQPATRIHQIAMGSVEATSAQVVDVAPGHTQPATRIHQIAMQPVAATRPGRRG